MSLILSIETSAAICSVALHQNGQLVDELVNDELRKHAQKLLPMIEQVLAQAKLNYSDLKAIAISSGPGSYTGLRIASSTAKGLCYALDIPLIAINTLELLATNYRQQGKLICPMIDARRMEVYTCIYDFEGQLLSPVESKIIEENSFSQFLSSQTVIFCGDGASKCKTTITHKNAIFVDYRYTSASKMGLLAYSAFENEKFADVAYFEPFYLKEFVALTKKMA